MIYDRVYRRVDGLTPYAGTGTILDAWKIGVPLIVVPNAHLLDNHQAQMADHLAKEGYATQSTAEYVLMTSLGVTDDWM